ncbi:MAG: hypothetical protein TU35_002005 [Thermoproteus sp. AZ2]|jgi:hypothetical protein|uniref:Uncharacterized protein n=1 Tax=Thermoproteus sp. AZ2 TaxID=1609232 RepID=A0ACC6V065_9CREN
MERAEALILLVLAAVAWEPAPAEEVYSALRRAAEVAKRRLGVSVDWAAVASQYAYEEGGLVRLRDRLRLAEEVKRRLPLLYDIRQVVDEALGH